MTTTGPRRATRRYLRPPWMARHVGNRLAPLFRRGMIWHLSVAARRSGRLREVPVVLLESGGERYLVAARGHTDWSLNLAAARRAQLRHGHTAEEITVAEVPTGDRRPLIEAYVQRYGRMPAVARTFRALPDPADHPVFRIVSTRAPGPRSRHRHLPRHPHPPPGPGSPSARLQRRSRLGRGNPRVRRTNGGSPHQRAPAATTTRPANAAAKTSRGNLDTRKGNQQHQPSRPGNQEEST